MTMTVRRFCAAVCLLLAGALCSADFLVSSRYGYTIDFPEGFDVLDGEEDGSSALLQHQFVKVQVMLKVWETDAYADVAAALAGTFSKIGASGDIERLRWRNQPCALAQFTMQNTAVRGIQSGWAAAFTLPQGRGFLSLLAYSDAASAFDTEQFMLSVLDSVMIDHGSFRECGIVTAAAFPSQEKKTVTLTIGGKRITTQLGAEDEEASQFVIDREFEVFKLYVRTSYWKEAWQRFYRQIARDGFGRAKRVAFDISAALHTDAAAKDSQNPDAAMAQLLLEWAQGFEYARKSTDINKADFANLPSVLAGGASDCDSRALLLAVLLKQMNIESCIFISSEYSHALLGVVLNGKLGQTITADGNTYLVGDTTAARGITLGMLDAAMQDRGKWIPVTLP